MTESRHSRGLRFEETLFPGALTPRHGEQDARNQQILGILPPLPFKIESWRVTEVLASGGMGVTFVGTAEDDPERKIVLKMPLTLEGDILSRFRHEILVLSELDHPNIVKLLGSGEATIEIAGQSCELPWLVMEYVSGQSLRARLLTSKRMTWGETYGLLESVLGGLGYLHQRNLCHRDIKPDNLINDPVSGNWILVDFGIAKNMLANPQLTLTIAQSDPGALDYMSPEQIAGGQVDIRSDIYSLGKTAWEALIGQVPRVGTPYPSVELGVSVVPLDVDRLVEKMVAHRAEARFQEPSEVLEALQAGMKVIESRKRAQIRNKKVRTNAKFFVAAVTVLILTAFVLNGVGKQKVEEIYQANINISCTFTEHALERYKIEHWFWAFCGRSTFAQRLAEISPKADREKATMLGEYKNLLDGLGSTARDDNSKLEQCEGFLSSHQHDFSETLEFYDVTAKKDDLLMKVLTQEVDALRSSAATAEKNGDDVLAVTNTKQAMQLCDNFRAQASQPAAKREIEKLRDIIVAEYSAVKLAKIRRELSGKDASSVLQAQAAVVSLEKELGASPGTQAFLRELDDDLWNSQSEQYTDAIKQKDFGRADEVLDRYEQYSEIKAHKVPLAEMRKRIHETEDENDWTVIDASAKRNLEQQAFRLAKRDYDDYITKWQDKDGKHVSDAERALANVAQADFTHLMKLDTNAYDDFTTDLGQFMDDFPSDKEDILTAQRALVARAIGRMIDVWNAVKVDDKTTFDTALDNLAAIQWNQAEPEKREYLDTLRESIREFLRDPGEQSALKARYYFERPPTDCVTNPPESKTVYQVTLKSVEVDMSDKVFYNLKGTFFDSKPKLIVNVCQNDSANGYPKNYEVSSNEESIVSQTFTQAFSEEGIYLDTEKEIIQIIFKDDSWHHGFPDMTFRAGTELKGNSQLTWTSDSTNVLMSFSSQ